MRHRGEYLIAVRALSIISLLLGLVSVIAGILTLSYAQTTLVWPLNSGAPIWTGVVVLLAGILGCVSSTTDNPSRRNTSFVRQLDSFLVFTVLSLVVCALDFAHAVAILGECAANINTVATWCTGSYEEHLILASVSLILAVVMATLAVGNLVLYGLMRRDLVIRNPTKSNETF